MSCASQFPNELNLSCVLGLVTQIKEGVSIKLVKESLWVAGSILEKISPVETPILDEVSSMSGNTLEDCCDSICDLCMKEMDSESFQTSAAVTDWTVFLPLILQLVKLLMDRRVKPSAVEVEDVNPAHAFKGFPPVE